ncbi:hypothetical protein WA1_21100 [Scytonema hofmannii PCC 7110]|uniref:Uncharacterized protein n=2 Tax=Scytonema hofmannii TaxID=34078 RepID=A0A139XCP2_9CYAN|nr:hypothetical protein WA1_21100 [Scytonema hofmannii PCC 7110]
MATSNQPIVAKKLMTKSIFASKTIWRTVLAGVVYLAPLTVLEFGMMQVIPSMFNPLPAEASNRSYTDMLNALGRRETGQQNPRYDREEDTGLRFIGKYQFGEALLIDLGYYQARCGSYYVKGQPGPTRNEWNDTWTGKRNVRSLEDLKNSRNASNVHVQEYIIREAFHMNYDIINQELGKQGKSIRSYIGQSISGSQPITLSGLLAGAHLVGPWGVKDFLLNGTIHKDENFTTVVKYIDEFRGYSVTEQNVKGFPYTRKYCTP